MVVGRSFILEATCFYIVLSSIHFFCDRDPSGFLTHVKYLKPIKCFCDICSVASVAFRFELQVAVDPLTKRRWLVKEPAKLAMEIIDDSTTQMETPRKRPRGLSRHGTPSRLGTPSRRMTNTPSSKANQKTPNKTPGRRGHKVAKEQGNAEEGIIGRFMFAAIQVSSQ